MKILGIDPGYGRCGYAVLEKSAELKLITSGIIETKPKTNFADRLVEIAQDFEYLLQVHKPKILSIEDLFFAKNVTTGLKVAQVRGILIFLAKKYGCQIFEPKPVEIKSVFTGNGKADKSQMKKMCDLIFAENSPKIDDAVDAVAAGFWVSQNNFIND